MTFVSSFIEEAGLIGADGQSKLKELSRQCRVPRFRCLPALWKPWHCIRSLAAHPKWFQHASTPLIALVDAAAIVAPHGQLNSRWLLSQLAIHGCPRLKGILVPTIFARTFSTKLANLLCTVEVS
ncbi:unnamed protein product [Symbiodinium necroappetens]|uniref:Uncharacterized protein n=1 Tax=Symbiodinium necroappetens TaxID=1628268 RepID=A0A812ZY97_9DINO|nr:unnamed protein product [Symbiodinium necroappetens]